MQPLEAPTLVIDDRHEHYTYFLINNMSVGAESFNAARAKWPNEAVHVWES